MAAVNIEAKLRPGETSERLIKRFFKKCKKHDIVREYLNKTSYFRTKRQKKREKVLRNKHIRSFAQNEENF